MADSLGQFREAPREKGLAALRVLRAKRQREPTKRERWSRLSLAIALLFSAAMFAFLSARASFPSSEHASTRSSARPALRTASGAQSQSSAPAAPGDSESARQALPQPSTEVLRARAASDASALRVVNAVPGNPFGIRAGDVIVDLCDRAGVESAVEISAALADNSAGCVVILRGDHIVRAARPSADVEGPNQ